MLEKNLLPHYYNLPPVLVKQNCHYLHLAPQAMMAFPVNTGCPPLEYIEVFKDNFFSPADTGKFDQQQQVWQFLLDCLD